MKGYYTPEIKELMRQRSNYLAQLEVISMEIGVINRKVMEELAKTFAGRNIQFDSDNRVQFMNDKSEVCAVVPSDRHYEIIKIRSSNTILDIIYSLKASDGEEIMVKQENFHSFKFIEQ